MIEQIKQKCTQCTFYNPLTQSCHKKSKAEIKARKYKACLQIKLKVKVKELKDNNGNTENALF